jgi:hypothetical protein
MGLKQRGATDVDGDKSSISNNNSNMVMDESKPKTEDINCPFLKMAKPDTSSFRKFVSSTSAAGMSYPAALLVSFDNVSKQKGTSKALSGHALDLYALNQIDGVSHPDKYNRYKELTTKTLTDAANEEGKITMQDLVDLKKQIAAEEKIDHIMESSQTETVILFIGAG